MDALPPPPASTQVLANPDLLHGIFTFVPLASANRHIYLVRCTTVCRAFHEPANRLLWRNLETLLPLWNLLAPSNVPYPFGYSDDNGRTDNILLEYQYLKKVNSTQLYLDPIRWDRFLWHTAHVRRVIHFPYPYQAISDAIRLLIQRLVVRNGGHSFLPLLHIAIHWRGGRPMPCDALVPFFTSTLRYATLTFVGSPDETIAQSLRRLRESAPFLEKIAVLKPNRDEYSFAAVIQELLCFTRLHQIRISRISGSEAFRALVTKPNLTRLIGVAIGPWVAPSTAISVHHLRELSLTGDTSIISGIFNLVHFPELKRATICFGDSAASKLGQTTITSFLALFYYSVSTSDFQSFEFQVCNHYAPAFRSHGNEPLLRDLLAPILPLHGLRSFSLSAMSAVARTDDADIQALATTWPKLERLCIDRKFTIESSVSIDAIHHIYTHCTDLEELTISLFRFPIIGVHQFPAPPDRSPSHPLRRLSIRSTFVMKESLALSGPEVSDDGAQAMARYLLDLFPRLDPRPYDGALDESGRRNLPPNVQFDGRWNKVMRRIYSICSARGGL